MVFWTACALSTNLWWALHSNEFVHTACMIVVILPMLLMGITMGQLSGTVWNSLVYLVPKENISDVISVIYCLFNV
jgi:hypothetical protein